MILISILIYFSFSAIFCISFFNRIGFGRLLQVFFLTTITSNAIIYSILNQFSAINQPVPFLIIQFIVFLVLSILIRKENRFSKKVYLEKVQGLFSGFRWFDFLLAAFIVFIIASFFFIGVTTPPNNLDSLDPTNLTRILYWMQEGSFSHLSDGWYSFLMDPILLHIQGIWLYALGKSENLFFLVQWFSLGITAVTIYQISRLLKFSVTSSLLSALVGLSMPVALLQAYSFQGDLTVAVLVIISISFGLAYLQDKSPIDLIGSCLSFVLALGTKKAAFLTIPVFAVLILLWFISTRLKPRKLIPWVSSAVLILIITIIVMVGQVSLRNAGYFAGVPLLSDNQTPFSNIGEKVQYNSSRYLYQFVGLDGLPRNTQAALIDMKAGVFEKSFLKIGLDLEKEVYLQPGYDEVEKFRYSSPLTLSEEFAWFGPLSFLLFPATLVFSFFSKEKKRRRYAVFSLVLFITFLILVLFQRPGWDPYQGRYFLLSVLPLVPMISILFPRRKVVRTTLFLLIIPLGLFLSFNTFFVNNSKPVITAGKIWGFQFQHILTLPDDNKYELFIKNKLITVTDHIADAALDRPTIYELPYWQQVYYSSLDRLNDILYIDPLIPDGETVYLDIPVSALDYGLFGKNKDRRLFHIKGIEEAGPGYFITDVSSTIIASDQVTQIGQNGGYCIYKISTP